MTYSRSVVPMVGALTLALWSVLPVRAAPILVTVDTSALAGTSAQLAFDLLDNDGVANNAITITGFSTTGVLAPCSLLSCTLGDVTGTLPGAVSLADTAGFGEVLQDITFGTSLLFTLDATTAFAGGVPDRFSLLLLDPATSFSLVDTDLDGDALLTLDLDGSRLGTLRTATVTVPSVPVTAIPAAVPAPATGWLIVLASASVGLGAALRRKTPRAGGFTTSSSRRRRRTT